MTATIQQIRRIIHTASSNDTVYAVGDHGRVFVEDTNEWATVGFLIGPVRLGEELRFITDDIVTITSPVIGIEDRARQLV